MRTKKDLISLRASKIFILLAFLLALVSSCLTRQQKFVKYVNLGIDVYVYTGNHKDMSQININKISPSNIVVDSVYLIAWRIKDLEEEQITVSIINPNGKSRCLYIGGYNKRSVGEIFQEYTPWSPSLPGTYILTMRVEGEDEYYEKRVIARKKKCY